MVYVQRVKDKTASKKRKKDGSSRYEDNSIITYKKSKKKKIRREHGEPAPTYIFNTRDNVN